MQLLSLNNISYSLEVKKKQINILRNISFSINKNEIIGISGESGGGKTTLAKIIAGITEPTNGKIIWNAENNNNGSKRSHIQILFQNHGEVLNPYRKVKNIIDEAIKISKIKDEDVVKERISILNSVGIKEELYGRKGSQLSGGEQQRVALARLLAVKPELLILDEPFSAQDIHSQVNLVKLFKDLNIRYNLTMICISHDLKILRNLAGRIIIIKNGEIVESGNADEIFVKPQHPYTRFLLSAESLSLTHEEIKNNL
jgi:ABC-type dipeptide/oligopeptide/nickel transport system ATPase subunit